MRDSDVSGWSTAAADGAREVLALALPVSCAGCGADGRVLCGVCRAGLDDGVRIRSLRGAGPALPVASGFDYAGPARSVVLAFKNGGRTDLVRPLAARIAAAVGAALEYADVRDVLLVPMPRTRRSARERGYDPTVVLLRRAGLPVTRALASVRAGRDQAALDRAGRFENAGGSVLARSVVRGRPVLLVDDVVTTGATLLDAARAVDEAGGRVVGAATLASTPRREV